MVIAGLILLGLCIGSFINALVWRLHMQAQKKTRANKDSSYSIARGRSMCPHCKHVLSVKDLVPVFSWLALHGKCRYCDKPISSQYPLVEAMTAVLFVFLYVFWPYELISIESILYFVFWLIFLSGFIALTIYDIKYLILPNKIIFPLLTLAIAAVVIRFILTTNYDLLISTTTGAAVGGGIFYALFQVSKGAWIGGGDVKLGFLLGALIGGIAPAFLMLFLASLMGTVYSVPQMLAKKVGPKSKIPFGPFLIASAIIVQLFGASLIDWYTNLFITGY